MVQGGTRWAWKIFMCQKVRTFLKINGSCREDREANIKNISTDQSWDNLNIKRGVVVVLEWIRVNSENIKSIMICRKRKINYILKENKKNRMYTQSVLSFQWFWYHCLIYYMANNLDSNGCKYIHFWIYKGLLVKLLPIVTSRWMK